MKKKYLNLCLLLLILYCSSSDEKSIQEAPAPTSAQNNVNQKTESSKSDSVSTWKKGTNIPNSPKLFVGDKEELNLVGEEIQVQIDGFRARVLLDCYYLNDKSRILEGNFKLQLPLEASPYYFAFGDTVYLDSKKTIPFIKENSIGKNQASYLDPQEISKIRRASSQTLKEARVVPKEKALYAYEETVRKNIDPAILEWAGADVFTGKVFPLQIGKLHRISIGYDVNLLKVGKEMIYSLAIPKKSATQIIHIDSAKIGNTNPRLNGNLQWSNHGNRISLRLENPKQNEIQISYPFVNSTLRESGNIDFFATRYTFDLNSNENQTKKKPAIFAVDISKSSNPNQFYIWINLMQKILKNNQHTIPKFAVLFFNIEAHWWKEEYLENTPENLNRLSAYVENLILVGATDLYLGLNEANKPSWSIEKNISKNIFLLSDGSGTWGESDLFAIKKLFTNETKVYAYKTGLNGTDTSTLEFITKSTGGAVYSVVGESELEKASRAHLKTVAKIDSIQMKGSTDILISGRPETIYEGQEVIITGRGEIKKDSYLQVQVSINTLKKEIKIPLINQIESSLTSRVFGQIATSQLEANSYLTEEFSKKYAMHFSIPGQTCSFLMLESEDDYERFGLPKEELLSFVKTNPVNKILESLLKQGRDSLLSQKARFLNWISTLENIPGISIQSKKLKDLAEDLKEESFKINSENIQSNSKLKSNYTSEILKELSGTELSYSLFSKSANALANQNNTGDGLKLLSSLIEANPGDGVLARDIAYSAANWNYPGQAYYLLKRVMKQKPFEPQTYHLAAQALEKLGNSDLAIIFYEIAYSTKWDPRFGDFNEIVALDYLHFLKSIERFQKNIILKDFAESQLSNLRENIKNSEGLMVAISWNTDRTDLDLHVIEPNKEECFYNHRKTKSGGSLTRDVTAGYGPELYVHPNPPKGKYRITAHYFSSDRFRTSVATKVKVSIYKNRGKENETITEKIITLSNQQTIHEIDIVEIP